MGNLKYRAVARDLDYTLLITVALLSLIGLLFIYSGTYSQEFGGTQFWLKQLVWLAAGALVMIVLTFIDYRQIVSYSLYIYIVMLGLLVFVHIGGASCMGAQRWINCGFFRFQPSEIAKLFLIIVLSRYLVWDIEKRKTFLYVVKAYLITLVPVLLIVKQPDLGTALVLMPIPFVMLFASGARLRYLVLTVVAGLATAPLGWFFLKTYQKERLLTFIDPNRDPLGAGYSIIQSKIAIGSGRLLGRGWLAGTQNRLNFIPERHTDFIFSIIGEELGFLGGVIVVSLFLILLYRALSIAQSNRDVQGYLISCGVVSLIGIHCIINIGMTIGCMPVTGLPLPFVSYGGSSILTNMAAIGLLENIHLRRYMF